MVNCNPETVSTDYDTSDRLFFEPLTDEDVLNVCDGLQEPRREPHGRGASRLGGQTPLKLARSLELAGIPVLGTRPTSIDAAEDREQLQHVVRAARHPAAPGGMASRRRRRGRRRRARSATRCSSGRRTCSVAAPWRSSTTTPSCGARWVSSRAPGRSAAKAACRPSGRRSIDRFLEDAIEVDVDALRDRTGEV